MCSGGVHLRTLEPTAAVVATTELVDGLEVGSRHHLREILCLVFVATDAEWRGRDASLEVLVGATFGGDEVIVAAAGGPYAEFIRAVARLRDLLAESTPRTCSFAVASTGVISELSEPRAAYVDSSARWITRSSPARMKCEAVARIPQASSSTRASPGCGDSSTDPTT